MEYVRLLASAHLERRDCERCKEIEQRLSMSKQEILARSKEIFHTPQGK